MQKQFFIVVPYDIIQLPKAGIDLSDKILGLFGKKKSGENQENKEFKEQLEQLEQKNRPCHKRLAPDRFKGGSSE